MKRPAPETRPVALTIAGSDSGGGAGIQADLATMASHGVYGTSAITAATAQHTRGVESSFVLPAASIAAQIDAVVGDFDVGAAKTGMLATTEVIELVADRARGFDFPLVVDPVMVATSGDRLLEESAERAYETLFENATLVTPNADEAEVLTGVSVEDVASAQQAGEELLEFGADAALVKGGHVPGETVRDVLVQSGDRSTGVSDPPGRTFEHERIDTEATHGSGCTLAAAIAARLASGEGLESTVEGATDFLARAIEHHYDVGQGPGAVNHGVNRD
ncbi:bifunctional hydroxymethylpyrimidine kinase/phosphomethylpyrimidine kinase [Natrarchaeobius halalkaliphilus]|uniref:Bifunctional hydroxymethylpyrimidine kinase/phosphomethylpyrimidine kinase n=1 Tax=Natrarchaeobius halalkaliphilus TaxID=1679091 RepID=A0A3N6LM18_9EURY|nr:bifunctional hydroxymethylpyrimidine kinase/phosphomethylpyrimidine kinase [Natrarchaeobius halalkaliphilus]